ncbi:hypothetical protein IQ37_02450 [Chryseobacterium piperi]|uniref:Lipoprotein n=1 Tax=Chryseobacterium piperi TaxID=558152 RepID=A0A086BM78_9FLAO|nr:hypothetical protein [Chryseobacterium piperi]ASW75404.1 hypothetical protein CJF12_14715 [Chryseobacterium piperi]KFF30042.1 hypothetical protein IQ37_02450 [Chryseobacterium piperi]
MKNLFFGAAVFSIIFISCSKKEPVNLNDNEEPVVHYDTTAIDSFSGGAISVDIARKIRMSSQSYKDSLKAVLKLQQEEKRIKEELEKENKKKQDEEKKKADQDKKQKTLSSENSPKEVKVE